MIYTGHRNIVLLHIMPKNTTGGRRGKKGKNKPVTGTDQQRRLRLKEAGVEDYAQVKKVLGDRRFELLGSDHMTYLGHVRGKLRKRCYIRLGDLVIFSHRDFQDRKVDIVHRFNEDQIKQIVKIENLDFLFKETDAVEEIGSSIKVDGKATLVFEHDNASSDDEPEENDGDSDEDDDDDDDDDDDEGEEDEEGGEEGGEEDEEGGEEDEEGVEEDDDDEGRAPVIQRTFISTGDIDIDAI